jgi:hypothetical protein
MPGTDRQPSSPTCLLVAGPGDLRVDQHQRLVALLGGVDHDHALVHVDLGGGQADAVGVVHGLQHVGDQGADARIDALHRLGHGVQARDRGNSGWFRRPWK